MLFVQTVGLAAACLSFLVAAVPARSTSYLAPLYNDHPDPIHGSYIVHFNDGHGLEDHLAYLDMTEAGLRTVVSNLRTLQHPPGFLGEFSDGHLEWIRRDPAVKHVGQNHYIEHVASNVDAHDLDPDFETEAPEPTHELRVRDALTSWTKVSQNDAPWHLSAICAAKKGDTQGPYQHLESVGKGVNIYIMDTGIELNHSEFGGRAVNFLGRPTAQGLPSSPPNDDILPRGHGTSVASVAGGNTCGVARSAQIVNAKIVEGSDKPDSGAWAIVMNDIIVEHRAYQRAERNAQAEGSKSTGFKGGIINLSLEFSRTFSGPHNDIINAASNVGIAIVVAAPNRNLGDSNLDIDANPSFPCNYRGTAVCVGSMNKAWRVATNVWGNNITMFAPGYGIKVANPNDGGFRYRSGNSYAAPVVAGVLATFMGYEKYSDRSAGSDAVQKMKANAIASVIPLDNKKPFGFLGVVNNGIQTNSDKDHPYGGIIPAQQPNPHDELKI